MDAAPPADAVTLGFGFGFADLATREGLVRLDRIFLERLAAEDAALHARLLAARAAPDSVAVQDESELVVALAPHLDAFVAILFGIEAETLRSHGKPLRSIRSMPANGCSCSARR